MQDEERITCASHKTIVLLGPPGSGKGTQASVLSRLFNIPTISTGAILRRECELGASLGSAVESAMLAGKLVPDEIINEIIACWVQHPDCHRGFLLDGYPRTLSQALYLDKLLDQMGITQPTVIHIDVPEEALLKRITGRRQCSVCNRIYNIYTQPPVRSGLCDYDGERLSGRADDTESAIRERLRQYTSTMEPVIRHYRSKKFNRVDGSDNPAMVLEAIESALGECAW